jgi:hypothetical protein
MSRFPGLHIFFIFIIANLPTQCIAFILQNRGFCATGPPNESLKAEYRRLSKLDLQNDTSINSEARAAVIPIEIDTWFHIVSGGADAEVVSDEMIISQVSGTLPRFLYCLLLFLSSNEPPGMKNYKQ